jgi:predicted GIY-YIG superfamily endonuclease
MELISTLSNVATAAFTSVPLVRASRREFTSTTREYFRATPSPDVRSNWFSEWFDRITDAIEAERQLKGWSRAKKQAFIRGDFALLQQLAKRRSSKMT